MIIMAAAHARATGDGNLVATYVGFVLFIKCRQRLTQISHPVRLAEGMDGLPR